MPSFCSHSAMFAMRFMPKWMSDASRMRKRVCAIVVLKSLSFAHMRLATGVFAAACLSSALAWGPVFHYLVACGAAGSADCMHDGSGVNLMSGAELPDAGFFGFAPFLMGSSCPANAVAIHDPLFAGFMLQLAGNSNTEVSQFAKGFGSHTISDVVGFAFPEGYFMANPAVLVNNNIDWLYTWPLMINIDSALWSTMANSSQPTVPTKPISAAVAAFVANATQQYSKVIKDFPVLSAAALTNCSIAWQQHLNSVIGRVAAVPQSAALSLLNVYDPYHSSTPAASMAALQKQLSCALKGVQTWLGAIQGGAAPLAAAQQAMGVIESDYEAGHCTP